MRSRFPVIPVAMPCHVFPPSCVRSSVPKSPAAYPTPPANSTACSVLPCGWGFPQFQPECPTPTTMAFAACANASTATSTSSVKPTRALMTHPSPGPPSGPSSRIQRDKNPRLLRSCGSVLRVARMPALAVPVPRTLEPRPGSRRHAVHLVAALVVAGAAVRRVAHRGGTALPRRPSVHARRARLVRLYDRDLGLLELPAVAVPDVALLARKHHHPLLGDDLVDRNREAGVVGLRLEEQVQSVGADVALVEVVVSRRRDAVRRRPALSCRPVRRRPGLVAATRIDARSRIVAGAVVEARVVAVIGNSQERLRQATGRDVGRLVDLVAVDDRSPRPGALRPRQRGVRRLECRV